MSASECGRCRQAMGGFVDGELTGAERLAVARHLDACPACDREVRALQQVGDLLRAAASWQTIPGHLDGLAAGVISRTRAESAQSWWSLAARACEDWHWMIVGGGSVAATFACATALSMILAFGPTPARTDSLAAFMADLTSPAGELLLNATPVGRDQAGVLLRVANDDAGGREDLAVSMPLPLAESTNATTEADLVDALADAMTHKGTIVRLDRMDARDRRYAESLLDQISRLRVAERVPIGIAFDVHQVRLLATASVSAKGS